MSDDEFRDLICENLACRLSDGEDCSKTMDHFLERCFYVPVREHKPCAEGFCALEQCAVCVLT